jgi:hypothetical protein
LPSFFPEIFLEIVSVFPIIDKKDIAQAGGIMNSYLVMGLFALYVVIVSLLRLMAEREFPRVTAMKRVWGRSRGLLLHFTTNVALPLVFGIIFLGRGVAGFGEPAASLSPILPPYSLQHNSSALAFSDLIDCISLSYTGECGFDSVPSFLSGSVVSDLDPGANKHSLADWNFLQP